MYTVDKTAVEFDGGPWALEWMVTPLRRQTRHERKELTAEHPLIASWSSATRLIIARREVFYDDECAFCNMLAWVP